MTNIEVYGDSILKGVTFSDEKQRYTINNLFSGFEGINVHNYSKFGCTIDKGIDILEKNIQNKGISKNVIIELGGNDADFCWKEISNNPKGKHFSQNTIENFYKKYTELIQKVKAQGAVPMITSIIPVDAKKYFDWICKDGLNKENILSWLGDVFAIYRYQEQFSLAIERIANEQNVKLIDIRSAFLRSNQIDKLFSIDGIHPSVEGQKIIKEELNKFILCNLF